MQAGCLITQRPQALGLDVGFWKVMVQRPFRQVTFAIVCNATSAAMAGQASNLDFLPDRTDGAGELAAWAVVGATLP